MENSQDIFNIANKVATNMHDGACEESVIGTILATVWAFPMVADGFCEDLFTDPICRACAAAIVSLAKRMKIPDIISVTAEVHRENEEITTYSIAILLQKGTTWQNDFISHFYRLVDLRTRRMIYALGLFLKDEGNSERLDLDELIAIMIKSAIEISQTGVPAGTSTLATTIEELEDFIAKRQEGQLEDTGTRTNFPELDEGGGLTAGQLNIIGGATSHGKTSLALTIVDEALKQNAPIAFFSLEMGRRELGARFISMESGVPSTLQLNPGRKAEVQEYVDVMDAAQVLKVRGTNLIFDDHFSSSIDHICGAIRSMHYKYHIKGVVIDYLQILGTNKHVSNREQLMGEVARQLKNLAVELDIWILALSQLNRDPNSTSPSIDRLRDSGQIAEAADRVIILYRPEVNGATYPKPFEYVDTHETAMINVVKNRNGQLAKFIVGFNPSRTLFSPLPEGAPIQQATPAVPNKSMEIDLKSV